MESRNRQLLMGFSVLLGALLLWTVGGQGLASADQLDDQCRSKCNATAQDIKSKMGTVPSQEMIATCVESCKRIAQIKSEAEIPKYCRSTCEEALRKANRHGDSDHMKACCDKCAQALLKSFRESRAQQQKGN
ncbi:MAG: hypothetical protein HY913_17670 [Desulfomonile tiedjei]|nr:hypothetical protein [Desulfomonile tiedjei]